VFRQLIRVVHARWSTPVLGAALACSVGTVLAAGPVVARHGDGASSIIARAAADITPYVSTPIPFYTAAPIATYASSPIATYVATPIATYASTPVSTYVATPVNTYVATPIATAAPASAPATLLYAPLAYRTDAVATSIVIANPSIASASVRLNFLKADGTTQTSVSRTIDVGSSALVYLPNVDGLTSGVYAATLESDRAVSAVVNVKSLDDTFSLAYNAIPAGAAGTRLGLPTVYRSAAGYGSVLGVQNTGTAAASISISYVSSSGDTVATERRTLTARAGALISPAQTSGLKDGFEGSVVVVADAPIVAVNLFGGPLGLAALRGEATGASAWNLPVIYHGYYGYDTKVVVQNLDTASTTVTIAYFSSSSGQQVAAETSATIAPGATYTFDQGGVRSSLPSAFNGSAAVRSIDGRRISAASVETNVALGHYEAYAGTAAEWATNVASCPSILRGYYGFDTSLTIQNVDTTPTNVTIVYVGPGGAAAQRTIRVAGGTTAFEYTPNSGVPVGFNGAATISTSGGRIVAVVNELLSDRSGDQLFTYGCTTIDEGQGQPTAIPTYVASPIATYVSTPIATAAPSTPIATATATRSTATRVPTTTRTSGVSIADLVGTWYCGFNNFCVGTGLTINGDGSYSTDAGESGTVSIRNGLIYLSSRSYQGGGVFSRLSSGTLEIDWQWTDAGGFKMYATLYR
jgi:hypothetical protein